MTEETKFRWMRAWVGALLAGLVVFVIFFAGIAQTARIPTLVLGVILLLLIAGLAVWSWRRGDRELATGLAVGYGLLTLISGGQCTLFVENGFEGGFFEGGFDALTALVAYPLLLIVALITGGVASMVRRRRAGKENLQ